MRTAPSCSATTRPPPPAARPSGASASRQAAQRQSAYDLIPQYDIKVSISQFDENLIRNHKDVGIGFQPFVNLGISRDAASSVMGLDLSVLTTDDLSILPGVTSRNSVVILKQGRGVDGDAAYHKFGVSYSMNLSKSEGQAQALRGLVELAVVELMGKLTKTPYWSCLGGDPQTSDEIRHELADWHFGMASKTAQITRFFPNRFSKDSFVAAAAPLSLPGTSRFEIVMNPQGVKETVACFATPHDVMAQLPAAVVGVDLEPLAATSLGQIRNTSTQVTSGALVQEDFHVQGR